MSESVSLKELVAAIIRRGRMAVLFAVLFGLLFGGYRAISLYSRIRNQGFITFQLPIEVYNEELDSYEREKRSLESSLAGAKALLAGQHEYNEKSLLMKVNPYAEWVSFVQLSFSDLKTTARDPSDERCIESIQQQYLLYFQCSDLQDQFADYRFSSSADMYIREMITLSVEDGGILLLQTAGASEQDAKQLADSLVAYFREANTEIAEASYPHSLVVHSQITKTIVNSELVVQQDNAASSVETIKKHINSIEAQLNSLKRPTLTQSGTRITIRGMINSSIKYTILGCAIGVLLDCFLVIYFLVAGRWLEFPSHFGKAYAIPFLGTLRGKGGLFERLSNWVLGEHTWESIEKAGAFVKQTADVLLQDSSSVGVLSTLPLDEKDASIAAVLYALKHDGRTLSYVSNAARSTETPRVIRDTQKLVLVERKGISHVADIASVVNLADAVGKPVAGYIIV